jgi:hypothetical protein
MFEDLVGFTWQVNLPFAIHEERGIAAEYGMVKLLEDGLIGYAVLAGGTDDFVVVDSHHSVGPTRSLVYQRLAFELAGFVAGRDLGAAPPADATRLLTIAVAETGEAAIREQLVHLYLRLYGVFAEPDSPDINDGYTLFAAALEWSSDVKRAWKVTLAALFQDSRMMLY